MDENKTDNGFFVASEYLDDYFAECYEHLIVIKRDVVTLEPEKTPEKKVIEELFRSFHTIKGLSGMVGLAEAETLSHALEDYFRALRDARVTVSKEGIDILIEGVKLLEEVLTAKKSGQTPPSINEFANKIKIIITGQKPETKKNQSLSDETRQEIESKVYEAIKGGMNVWQFNFVPSNELAAKGVNVSIVRSRLTDLGEILNAVPKITEDGGVAFEFIVATVKDESDFKGWAEHGLTWERLKLTEEEMAKSHDEEDKGGIKRGPERSGPMSITNIVRVDLKRLDELMEMVGELVITRARLDDSIRRISRFIPEKEMDFLQETHSHMERQLRNLREGVMRIRMVPIGEVFERMQFVVMDVAREDRKSVKLEISGHDTEIDKLVVERMMDPMLHLVRNAVSHGIETKEERLAKGKPPDGKIRLNAYTSGDSVVIEIEDDGRGMDFEKILSKARSEGIIDGDELRNQGQTRDILDIICASGFSTKEEADMASGRGIGMAIVKNAVEGLNGALSMETEPDKGTRFIINLPLTLLIVDALILASGGHIFAIPQPSVREVVEIEMDRINILENNELIIYRGAPLPIIRLGRVFGLTENYGPIVYGIILGSGSKKVGIMVEQMLTRREIVVRPITDPLVSVKGVAGATELGDGKPVLILHASDLINMASTKGGVLNA